jgi:hypothetical protein
MAQTENSALGRVVNETSLTGIPLVTRNFAKSLLCHQELPLASSMLANWVSVELLFHKSASPTTAFTRTGRDPTTTTGN